MNCFFCEQKNSVVIETEIVYSQTRYYAYCTNCGSQGEIFETRVAAQTQWDNILEAVTLYQENNANL